MFIQVRAIVMCAAIGLMVCVAPKGWAQGNPIQLDLPAQSLAKSLRAVATAANTNVLFDTVEISSRTAPALKGKVTVDEALSKLLVGTGLKFKYLDDKTIVLAVAEKGAESGSAADQMRVADNATSIAANPKSADQSSSDEQKNQVTVQGQRERAKPYADSNVDLPRTINDAQPYYIFDSKVIQNSGASNIEEFLKQRLTMNAATLSRSQSTAGEPTGFGNTSTINLRGLGLDQTLVLVNGRRVAGVGILALSIETLYQPDLNGIPLSAVERIEILPTSAAGIYGGGALGGVVNVILKKNYAGGEVRVNYSNTWNTDAPIRTMSAVYGTTLEGGKTQLMVTGHWSDAESLLLRDRRSIYDKNWDRLIRNVNLPTVFYSAFTPSPGAVPNIVPDSISTSALVLRNGVSLGSRITHIAPGTSQTTSNPDLYASLLANAGQWNFDLAESTDSPIGLRRQLGVTPLTQSFQVSLRRNFSERIEAFSDMSYAMNDAEQVYTPQYPGTYLVVPANSPINPFMSAVRMSFPNLNTRLSKTSSVTRAVTLGIRAELPFEWIAQFDYGLSENRNKYDRYFWDDIALNADVAAGRLNPFVDTLQHSQQFSGYLGSDVQDNYSTVSDFTLRGSGPMHSLPWADKMNVALAIERRVAARPESTREYIFPTSTFYNQYVTLYRREQKTDSAYVETTIPLVKSQRIPMLHDLTAQMSGRVERYTVDTGTMSEARTRGLIFYDYVRTQDGRPYFSTDTYSSKNHTIGLKYQPVPSVTVRASTATAFIPPAPAQLIKNPNENLNTTRVNDPVLQRPADVRTISGGNPDLNPQNSKSVNAGIILEPKWRGLAGLRLNAEYYRIKQFDAIGSLTAQALVDLEDAYPDRVVRNTSGEITLVDTSSLNLFRRETEGWDLAIDYQISTSVGAFSLRGAGTIIESLKEQVSLTQPELDGAGYHPVDQGGAKYKSNLSILWERGATMIGWTVSSTSSYKRYAAPGGPLATRSPTSSSIATYLLRQGGDTIPSQSYHDVFFHYAFPETSGNLSSIASELLRGTTLKIGISNVFDKVPPFDAYYSANFFLSPYGDIRMRTYSISATKQF